MRTFTNLLYDICTVLGLFREGENPAHKRKSTNFEMHQKFWDQRYNAISRIIDAEGGIVRSNGGSYMPGMNIFIT
ncbi:Uncharacterised protein [Escherichia coli]|nr:Uncharacterised protein [Escherichia coli]